MRVEPAVSARLGGLTADEVEERRARGQGNVAPPSGSRTYGQILRENVFTFINDVLFGLCVLLILVGRPLDAVTSIAVILTNVIVSVVQEVRAKRQLERIALLTRPQATVRRGGVEEPVSPDLLVVGDLLVLKPGDQVVLDGTLREGRVQVDESQLTGESDVLKLPGMPVYSGSFCVTGAGTYQADKVGEDSLANRITAGARAFRRALTPLQQQVYLVIRIVLVIVAYMEIVTILSSIAHHVDIPDAVAHSTVLATLVPNGLFISIAIAYAVGAVRIIRFGALVQQANAVESLCNVDVLCADKTGTLTLNRLHLEELAALDLDEPGFRRLLGVLAASSTAGNKTSETIAEVLPEQPVTARGEVPFSSQRKWSALAFDGRDGGFRGTYVLGAPEVLEPAIEEGVGQNAIRRWIQSRTQEGRRVLMVAHHPDPDAIPEGVDADVELPSRLHPAGLVAFTDTLRPGAAETLARFADSGIDIKIISGDSPDTVLALARQSGLGTDLRAVSGLELDELDDDRLRRVAERATVFGRVTPEQKERLIRVLRAGGHYVAMIGDGVNDVLSLKRANLGVAIQSGSQAARAVADMVLTNDSFDAMLPAVAEGRRILDGMQAILKLFLARIATLALVVVAGLIIGVFPIELRQGSALSLVTVGVPSVALAFWAHPRQPRRNLAADLTNFVAPVALFSSLLGLMLYCACWLVVVGHLPETVPAHVRPGSVERSAESCLVAFLILTGLLLVVFTRPPTRWWAVVERATNDWRPTILAAVLAVIFLAGWVSPLGHLFVLQRVAVLLMGLTFAAVLVWLVIIRITWRLGLARRSIGLDI